MNREQLEHAIRASGDILQEDEVIIVGSQAILGAVDEGLPKEVTLSTEVDVMAVSDPTGEKALKINGALGELSQFEESFGYYVEGVEDGLCRFPEGWRDRMVEIDTPATNGVKGLCVDPHDLCVAKLLAGRGKDLKYVAALLRSGHIKAGVLVERAKRTELTDDEFERLRAFVKRIAPPGRKNNARHVLRAAARVVSDSADETSGSSLFGGNLDRSHSEVTDGSESVDPP